MATWQLRAAGFVVGLVGVLASCTAPDPAEPPPLEERSVHPGINDAYRQDLQVEEWVQRFENDERELYEKRQEIVDALHLRPGMAVGDIGAGTGLFTLMMAPEVGSAGQVFAEDIVPEFLQLIARRAEEQSLGNVHTVLGTERSVALEPGTLDLAFVCDVYHHFEYPQSMLASIHNALKPGGRLVVVDFKRIPNVSSEWVMEHVRAGEEVVTMEIRNAGFALVDRKDLLELNYFLCFQRD